MRALGPLVFSSLASCILFVSPEEYGSTCRFVGEETQCGACVATKCRPDIDACCRDVTCDADMEQLESCAEFHDSSCTTVKSTARSLASCVTRECDAVCGHLTGSTKTNCREPRLGEGSACTCSAGGELNDFVCNTRAFPNTVCCKPEGWPAAGLACACRPLNCTPTADGCFCSLGDFTPKESECDGVHCCVDKDKCTCRADECLPFETPVESCTAAALGCDEGQTRVDECSARMP
jgi:hypothetical protein